MALMEHEEENDHSDRDLHPIERIFDDRIYTNGPDLRLAFQNGSIIWDTTIGAIPEIASIKDVEKTIARIVWLCASLTSIKWNASLYPLPIEVAQALEKRCELRTVIMEKEGSHLEIDMSCIPSNCESLSFCYAPSIHYLKGKLFSPPSFKTIVPPTPWLCFLDTPPFGVGIDDSKAPHARNPSPLHEESLVPLNAWVKVNLEERLLYWISSNLIQKLNLNSGLNLVGLMSVAPLLLKRMLPVWLALEKVAYAEETPHMVNREHAQEVNDCGAALRLIRDELQFVAQIRNRCTLKDVVQAWSNNTSDCQKEKCVNVEFYPAEWARWVFEDDETLHGCGHVYGIPCLLRRLEQFALISRSFVIFNVHQLRSIDNDLHRSKVLGMYSVTKCCESILIKSTKLKGESTLRDNERDAGDLSIDVALTGLEANLVSACATLDTFYTAS